MSEPEDLRDEEEEEEENVDVDTEVERPIEGELSPGRLEEGTPESRPVDPRTGSPMST